MVDLNEYKWIVNLISVMIYTYVCSAISISNVTIVPVFTWNMYNTILAVCLANLFHKSRSIRNVKLNVCVCAGAGRCQKIWCDCVGNGRNISCSRHQFQMKSPCVFAASMHSHWLQQSWVYLIAKPKSCICAGTVVQSKCCVQLCWFCYFVLLDRVSACLLHSHFFNQIIWTFHSIVVRRNLKKS